MGGDIDMRVLKLGNHNQKTGAAEDNYSNYRQYGLQWPVGLLRMDASRPPFRPGLEGVSHPFWNLVVFTRSACWWLCCFAVMQRAVPFNSLRSHPSSPPNPTSIPTHPLFTPPGV